MAELSAPARRALEASDIRSLKDLARRSEAELLALHGFGPASLPRLRSALREAGLAFAKSAPAAIKKAGDTTAYLARLPMDQRKALEQLRALILKAAPGLSEHFGYGLPGFKHKGHPVVYMGAAKNHLALYGSVPAGLRERLRGFEVSKGTIRFTPDKVLPGKLVSDIVRAKCVEIDLRWPPTPDRGAGKGAGAGKTGRG